jgi:hypothetical protein
MGTFYWDTPENKRKYVGEWKDSLPHGKGTEFEQDGETLVHSGNFFRGRFVGDRDLEEVAKEEEEKSKKATVSTHKKRGPKKKKKKKRKEKEKKKKNIEFSNFENLIELLSLFCSLFFIFESLFTFPTQPQTTNFTFPAQTLATSFTFPTQPPATSLNPSSTSAAPQTIRYPIISTVTPSSPLHPSPPFSLSPSLFLFLFLFNFLLFSLSTATPSMPSHHSCRHRLLAFFLVMMTCVKRC